MAGNKYKILLVEDERHILNLLKTILETAGYRVIVADQCALAETMYISHMPDLIMLDLGLPDKDGLHLLHTVRQNSTTPIIVVSARSNEDDKVRALDAGANDYITKPFGTAELLARVRTALRNNRYSAEEGRLPGGVFTLGDLRIEYDARRLYIKDTEIKLTHTEYNIMAFLSEHAGKMMTYLTIIKAIWGIPDEGSIKKLQVNMANIRKKLGSKPGEANFITNELGVGYRMNTEKDL